MAGIQLTLKLKPVQREPESRFFKLIDKCNYHVRYPDVITNVKSAKDKIIGGKAADLTNSEKAALKTLFQCRHDNLDPFGADLRWNPRYDRVSKCRMLFVKNREKLVD